MESKSNRFENVRETLSNRLKPWERTTQFWVRALNLYTSYKICQIRVKYVKGKEKQERMWEEQHEIGADRIYSLCSDLGGFFLKAAQIIGKPDLAPNAWVKKLVTLCDDAPATPFEAVQFVLEKELERKPNEIFERFERIPIGSASVAQVHRARIKGATSDVAVKVQHPGVQELMMTDIRNLKTFAAYLQKTDIKFDLVSVVQEVEKQVDYEFDFLREAKSMENIGEFLKTINKGKSPVIVPRPIWGMITRKVLVMEFMEGTSIMRLGDEMSKRGISPHGKMAMAVKRSILKDLTTAYGQMILKSGFFHADPHPGNILVTKDTKVVLLDYGQVKELPDVLRLGFASLIMALVSGDPLKIGHSFEELGIQTSANALDNPNAFKNLAQMMFDTKLPPGVKMASPFGEESSLNDVPVQSFPEELFFVLRTIQLLRGLSVGMGINYSCAEEWRQMAEETLSAAGRCIDSRRNNDKGIGTKMRFWRRKQRV
jgi:aarF domain-containing kinase